MTRRSVIAGHRPRRDDFYLEPTPIYVAPHPRAEIEDGATHARERISDPGRPFGSLQQITQTLRARGRDALVDVIGRVFPARPLTWHDYVNASAAFQQRLQNRQFPPWLEGMFERVIGNNDIDCLRRDYVQRFRRIRKNRDAIGFGRFPGHVVGFDPELSTPGEINEQEIAAATKIEQP
jgi:hypothetical protein